MLCNIYEREANDYQVLIMLRTLVQVWFDTVKYRPSHILFPRLKLFSCSTAHEIVPAQKYHSSQNHWDI